VSAYNRPIRKVGRFVLVEERMKKDRTLLLASSLLALAAVGCSSQPAADPPAAAVEPLPTAEDMAANGRPQLVAAMRGAAELGFLQPDANTATVGGQAMIVTEIQVMNLSDAPIAGLTVEDLWYDGDGNTVSGDTYRHPTPLAPNEPITVTLRVPRVPNMTGGNQDQFAHANGEIVPTLMDEFPEPAMPAGEAPAAAPAP
jgi:hypothetical protein